MTILCSQSPFAPVLLRNMRNILDLSTYLNDLTIIGQDGQFVCSGFLIGAISPLLQTLDETISVIMLPDFSVQQLSTFLKYLTSDSGPKTCEDQLMFKNVLKLFGETVEYLSEKVVDCIEEDNDDKDDKEELFVPEINTQNSPELPTKKTKRLRKKLTKGNYVEVTILGLLYRCAWGSLHSCTFSNA